MTHPIRYSRLGYAALKVTDLAASTRFYSELMGLKVERSDASTTWLRCSDKPYDLVLEAGPAPGLSRVGFELENHAELIISDALACLRYGRARPLFVFASRKPGWNSITTPIRRAR
jgi:catechol 2,3-dioxygenase-like lactoylglutathione lyase family enzyme